MNHNNKISADKKQTYGEEISSKNRFSKGSNSIILCKGTNSKYHLQFSLKFMC